MQSLAGVSKTQALKVVLCYRQSHIDQIIFKGIGDLFTETLDIAVIQVQDHFNKRSECGFVHFRSRDIKCFARIVSQIPTASGL